MDHNSHSGTSSGIILLATELHFLLLLHSSPVVYFSLMYFFTHAKKSSNHSNWFYARGTFNPFRERSVCTIGGSVFLDRKSSSGRL
jgi:hypothetical protein